MKGLTERAYINAMFKAYRTLIDEYGWREIMYAPKDGTPFEVCGPSSTGIFPAQWLGEKNDLLFVADGGDLWPCGDAALFRLTSKPREKP